MYTFREYSRKLIAYFRFKRVNEFLMAIRSWGSIRQF